MHCSLAMFLHVFFLFHIRKAFVHNNLVFPRIKKQKKYILHASVKHHHFIINDIKSVPIYLNRVVIMIHIFTAHD